MVERLVVIPWSQQVALDQTGAGRYILTNVVTVEQKALLSKPRSPTNTIAPPTCPTAATPTGGSILSSECAYPLRGLRRTHAVPRTPVYS